MSADKTTQKKRATLRDVARLCGVSNISVSRVMRNSSSVSPRMRERVLKAAKELGYTPNRLAEALKSQSSDLVAVVIPSVDNSLFAEVLHGIEVGLSEAGLQAVLGVSHYDQNREKQVLQNMLAWSPLGIIMAGTAHDPSVRHMIDQQGIPVVEFMDIDNPPIQTSVGISNTKAAIAVADLLKERGYSKPGYVGAWGERPDRSKTRRLAFMKRLEELNIPLVDMEISPEPASTWVGAESTQRLLERSPEIDAIFFANDDQALGGLFRCQKLGMKIPQEIGIIGFNGIEIGASTPIILTSVQTPLYQIGTETARLLLNATSGKVDKKRLDLGFNIRMGESI